MRLRSDVTDEKLRGGFYTPDPLVDFVVKRATADATPADARVLEPSAGDGAFLRGLARAGLTGSRVTAVEIVAAEAAKARSELDRLGLTGNVVTGSMLQLAMTRDVGEFDVAIGNLPFVRFQFITHEDRAAATAVVTRVGLDDSGVSNLWIPMLVSALSLLKVGGRFAFVLPAECFTGVSAGRIREWLLTTHEALTVDLFPPRSFPGVLQEVVVVSGRKSATTRATAHLTLVEHASSHHETSNHESAPTVVAHRVTPSPASWTRLLLSAAQLEAYEEARRLAVVKPLNAIAQLEVATVTGANAFFSVDAARISDYDLRPWLTPLLPRIRHAPGLRFTEQDHELLHRDGKPAHLLTIPPVDDLSGHHGLLRYLKKGAAEGLPDRFKCRVRDPWYSVPGIKPSPLMLTKRSHHFPRMVLNEAGVVTTDTIYRGRPVGNASAAAIVASFHNSLTLLAAELEGRSFGGGVLELVPSEFNRLLIPDVPDMADELDLLDSLSRAPSKEEGNDELVAETDRLLMKHVPALSDDILELLAEARHSLLSRRLART